jgi:radical SAM superfamily enzyme YgiQ (UPF0313 family)
MPQGRKIVLTADRSLMTNYRGNYLFGFLACGPYRFETSLPYDYLFCPTIEADRRTGEAKVAQCGLRRVESSLVSSGQYNREDVLIAHPNYLEKVIGENTKVVGINAMDPLGMAPVTSTMSSYKEGIAVSYVAAKFEQLMKNINRLKQKYKFKTVLGGAGAWQFHLKERRERFDLDHVIQGEADLRAPEIFHDIESNRDENGEPYPEFSYAITRSVEDIPIILGPTINSTIEAMRGCGRGCDFCDVNKRKKRDFPIQRLEKEAKYNFDYGFETLWLHSDEMLLYDCTDLKNYYPNRDAIVELYSAMRKIGFRLIGTTHKTLSAVCADPLIIPALSKVYEMSPSTWLAVQPGLETTAPRLAKRHLAYKTKPFSPEEWHSVVLQGVKILNANYYYPALTLIVGLPSEEPDETRITIETVRALKDSKCILAPLLYQDYNEKNTMRWENMTEAQFELFWTCWKHNLAQFSSDFILVNAVQRFDPLTRTITKAIIRLGVWGIFRYLRGLSKHNFKKLPEDVIKVAA